jgi:hypothetical protein
VGLQDQGAGVVVDQEDAALGFQGEPGQFEEQAQDSVHLLVQGDWLQRDA